MSGLIWVLAVCKGYEQTTLVGNELMSITSLICFSVSSHLVKIVYLYMLKFSETRVHESYLVGVADLGGWQCDLGNNPLVTLLLRLRPDRGPKLVVRLQLKWI